MPPFGAGVSDLPDTLPVFPLAGALLLPRGRLPLNIFEPRYLAMTEDALAAGRLLGMVQPDPSQAEGPHGPALYRVGCLGRLISFSETDDGRYLITLLGVSRFRIVEEAAMGRGYRRVRADYSAFGGDAAVPEGAIERAALLEALRPYFSRRGIDANWEAIKKMPDPELVTTLAMVCPFDPVEKQALLEAPALPDRAATLVALLRMDAHSPTPQGDPPPRGQVS